MADPAWDTPARLDGLPVTNWKRRTGYSQTGTVAELVERWLSLAFNHQQECSLGWGPNAAGAHGCLHGDGIGRFVLRADLPPQMQARLSRPLTREEIERKFSHPGWRPDRPSDKPGPSTP